MHERFKVKALIKTIKFKEMLLIATVAIYSISFLDNFINQLKSQILKCELGWFSLRQSHINYNHSSKGWGNYISSWFFALCVCATLCMCAYMHVCVCVCVCVCVWILTYSSHQYHWADFIKLIMDYKSVVYTTIHSNNVTESHSKLLTMMNR